MKKLIQALLLLLALSVVAYGELLLEFTNSEDQVCSIEPGDTIRLKNTFDSPITEVKAIFTFSNTSEEVINIANVWLVGGTCAHSEILPGEDLIHFIPQDIIPMSTKSVSISILRVTLKGDKYVNPLNNVQILNK